MTDDEILEQLNSLDKLSTEALEVFVIQAANTDLRLIAQALLTSKKQAKTVYGEFLKTFATKFDIHFKDEQ